MTDQTQTTETTQTGPTMAMPPGRRVAEVHETRRRLVAALGLGETDIAQLGTDGRHALDWLAGWGEGIARGVVELAIASAGTLPAAAVPSQGRDLVGLVAAARETIDGTEDDLAVWLDEPDALAELHRLADSAEEALWSLHRHPRVVRARADRGEPEPSDPVYVTVYDLGHATIADQRAAGVDWGNVEQCWTHAVAACRDTVGTAGEGVWVLPVQRVSRVPLDALGMLIPAPWGRDLACVDCQGSYETPQGVA